MGVEYKYKGNKGKVFIKKGFLDNFKKIDNMKIKDLIKILKKFDKDIEVSAYSSKTTDYIKPVIKTIITKDGIPKLLIGE